MHEQPEMFCDALALTRQRTGFAEQLIEKDYFCTLLLKYLALCPELVFKGETCLAKVHADFYRLSEDLDYAVRKLGLRANDAELIALVRQKLAVQGNEPVDVSAARLAE